MRHFLIACGTLLVVIPLLWMVVFVMAAVCNFWFDGTYPSRYDVAILVLTSIVGAVMIVVGMDIVSSVGRESDVVPTLLPPGRKQK